MSSFHLQEPQLKLIDTCWLGKVAQRSLAWNEYLVERPKQGGKLEDNYLSAVYLQGCFNKPEGPNGRRKKYEINYLPSHDPRKLIPKADLEKDATGATASRGKFLESGEFGGEITVNYHIFFGCPNKITW